MKLRLMIYKWVRGHCRHICAFCKYRNICMLGMMFHIKMGR